MNTGSLPRRYARALIQLAGETDAVEPIGRSLTELTRVLQRSSDLLATLANDFIDFTQRLAAMEEIASRQNFPQILKNFLCLLVKKERVSLLPDIVREYRRFEDEILGIVRVRVETPSAPEAPTLERVGAILGRQLNKKVIPEGKADPSMIGGMILKIDHRVYDGSIRRELERIKENMLKG